MSVSEEHGMRCPKCGEDHSIIIAATVNAHLLPDGVEEHDGAYEWSSTDACRCTNCGHSGLVEDFQIEDEDEDEFDAAA